MSRIAKQNEKYLARVRQSMDREKNYRAERQRERDEAREVRNADRQHQHDMERLQHDERNWKITQSNERYSDLWIATTGISVPLVIDLALRGGDGGMLLNRLDLRVYNRSSKASVDINLITLMKMLHDKNFPDLPFSPRGQVSLDDIVIPAKVYFFIRYHWLLSSGQAQNKYNLNTEIVSPSIVPMTTPEDMVIESKC